MEVRRASTDAEIAGCFAVMAGLRPDLQEAGFVARVRELAETVARVTGFQGRLVFDAGKPDGAPRKLMDVSRLSVLGWRAGISLEDGLRDTYRWFVEHCAQARLT